MGRTVVRLPSDGVHEVLQDVHRAGAERGIFAAVHFVLRLRRRPAGLGLAAVVVVAGGCGGGSHFANQPKPAEPITVTAAIDRTHVRVSPASFGAGPITIIVSNQSGVPQTVTFQTNEVNGGAGGITKSAGPVADRNTTTLQANPRQGTYSLSVKAAGINPAAITVGKPRPASSNQLAQP